VRSMSSLLGLGRARHAFGTLTLALGITLGGPAWAQRAEDVAAARALAVEGIKLADAGDCRAAVEKLERAEALRHAPTILGRLGECQVALGKIVLGTENLQRVVREQLAADAPAAFRDAQVRAQKVLDSALPRIGKLKIVVEPAGTQASVKVNGEQVPPAVIGIERPTDPGNHQVEASAPGYLPASAAVRLPDGGSETVTLRLQPDPNAAAGAPPVAGPPPPMAPQGAAMGPPPQQPGPAPAPTDPGADAPSGGGNKTLAFVALGVGGAGLIAGSITGLMAMSKTKDLEDLCDAEKVCRNEDSFDEYDSANNLATISTIAFGVGIVGVGAGVILLVTSGGKSEPAAKTHFTHAGVTYRPWVGVGSAGVSGSF
jgi:hypothetical protein